MWQQIICDEIESVVGDSMPEFDDVTNLPVSRAVMKEVLRWWSVTAGGKEFLHTSIHIFKDSITIS